MKNISFCKMHGSGNDFVVIDNIRQNIQLKKEDIIRLSDRHRGIGFDQLLVLKTSSIADLACQIFNADGSEAEQCGNGMRCVARYVHEEKIVSQPNFSIETLAGKVEVELKDYEHIRMNMGLPQIKPQTLTVKVQEAELDLTPLSLGNPHAIHRVTSLNDTPVSLWGAQLEKHAAFPQGVNTGFMEVMDRSNIRLRTYERGAGETLACGSNACAAVVAGIRQGWLDSRVKVHSPGGSVEVEWAGDHQPVFLNGPAVRVFCGEVALSI